MSGRRIELSATHVIASMLAAVTGAIAASYTGIGGTIVGVAVMSVASTAGATVYKHYLGRSKERLRSAAVVIAPVITPRAVLTGPARHRGRSTGPLARAPGGQAGAAGEHTGTAGDHARAAGDPGLAQLGPVPGQLSGWPWSPDAPVTDEFPAVSGEATRWTASPAETAAAPASSWQAASTSTDHAAPEQDGADGADSGDQGADGTGSDNETARTAGQPAGRRRWLAMAGAAAGVFVLTLGGITAFEVVAGKPLDALIWGRHSAGTTVGDATGAQQARSAPRPTPQRATPAPSRPPAGSPTATPTPLPSSPTPAPTRSPSPSPSPSLSSPAPAASPSPSGSAGR